MDADMQISKAELLRNIAEFPNDPKKGDRELNHSSYDALALDVLAYVAAGGKDAKSLTAAFLRLKSPLEWGWYA